jgi:YVTN family beta-propeller protein
MKAPRFVAASIAALALLSLSVSPAWGIATPLAPITVGNAPVGVTFNPAGTLGYTTISSSNKVAVVDRATGTTLAPITVGNGPMSIAFLPDGTKAYVANYSDNSVTVINPTSGAILSTIPVGLAPFFIAVSPDGTRAYVPNSFSSNVSVIDTTTDTVATTLPVGAFPVAVAFNPTGTRAYVVVSTNNVIVFDATTSTFITTIALGGMPYGAAVSPDGDWLYVSQYSSDTVSIIETATNTVVATVAVANEPEGVTFDPAGDRAYVPTVAGVVSVIDVATKTALAPIPSGAGSRILAFTPDGALAYVTNTSADTLTVIEFDDTLPTISGTPAAGTISVAYSFTPAVTGPAVAVSVQTGTLPPGLSLAAGVISGTPTTPGSFPVTLRATNGNGFADLAVTITVAPTITGAATVSGPVGSPLSWTPVIAGSGGQAVTSTTLPSGLLLDASTGVISGTPTGAPAVTPVTLTVTDGGATATFTVTITVTHAAAQSLTITPSDATPAQGQTITLTVTALDGYGNTWDVSGTAVITSSVTTDVINGNQVTFPHASPHLLTARLGQVSGSLLLQVSARSGVLGLTGSAFELWVPLTAVIATALGVALAVRAGSIRWSR